MKADRKSILVKFTPEDLAMLDDRVEAEGTNRMSLIVRYVRDGLVRKVGFSDLTSAQQAEVLAPAEKSEVPRPKVSKAKTALAVAERKVGVEPAAVVPDVAPKGAAGGYFDGQGRERAGARLKGTGFFQRGRRK